MRYRTSNGFPAIFVNDYDDNHRCKFWNMLSNDPEYSGSSNKLAVKHGYKYGHSSTTIEQSISFGNCTKVDTLTVVHCVTLGQVKLLIDTIRKLTPSFYQPHDDYPTRLYSPTGTAINLNDYEDGKYTFSHCDVEYYRKERNHFDGKEYEIISFEEFCKRFNVTNVPAQTIEHKIYKTLAGMDAIIVEDPKTKCKCIMSSDPRFRGADYTHMLSAYPQYKYCWATCEESLTEEAVAWQHKLSTDTVTNTPTKKLSQQELYYKLGVEWMRLTGLKVGDKVKVISIENRYDQHCVIPEMTNLSEKIGVVTDITNNQKSVLWISVKTENTSNHWWWPYYCLEKVENETKPNTFPEFATLQGLYNKCKYIGFVAANHRHIIASVGYDKFVAVSHEMHHGDGSSLVSKFTEFNLAGKFRVFKTAKDLYDWMGGKGEL